jgi:predicted transcriptional regulator/RIO-like serine/threonine protein kinase
MGDDEEEQDLSDALDRLGSEVAMADRHLEVLALVAERGPMGVTRLSDETGYDHSELRYSLRVLEEENLIEPTAEGAEPTARVPETLTEYNDRLGTLADRLDGLKPGRATGAPVGGSESAADPGGGAGSASAPEAAPAADTESERDDADATIALTPSQETVLRALVEAHRRSGEPVTAATVADAIDRHPGTMRNHIDSLTALALIEDAPDAAGYVPTADARDRFPPGADGTGGDASDADGTGTDRADAGEADTDRSGASGGTSTGSGAVAGGRDGGSHGPPGTVPAAPDRALSYDDLSEEAPIGAGGNADVVRAVTPDGTTVAVKTPRMADTLDVAAVERLLEEAETWDRLDDHDHVVGVVDYGSEPLPWIIMEHMDGGHLGARAGELPLDQALWTAIAITRGVRHAHRRGVAHLDLKPENVLFGEVEGAWDVPKVADWGLSKHLLEHSKSVEGLSPGYAAPEQFDEGFGNADDLTDIYQLGAVFYELFTGEPPFEGKPARAMRKVLTEEPTPPSEVADVPEGLDEVLLTALAKEKADRYESVLYLRDDLRDLSDVV